MEPAYLINSLADAKRKSSKKFITMDNPFHPIRQDWIDNGLPFTKNRESRK